MPETTPKLVRLESELVRWEAGLALFRARATRSDGLVVEAHAAAQDGESEAFWTVAEDRARSRVLDLLEEFSEVPSAAGFKTTDPVAVSDSTAGAKSAGDAAMSERPSARRAIAEEPVGQESEGQAPAAQGPTRRSATVTGRALEAASSSPQNPPLATPPERAASLDRTAPLSARSGSAESPADAEDSPETDPFALEADEAAGHEPSSRVVPPAREQTSSRSPSPEIRRPSHIRGEPGGTPASAPPSPPGRAPAPRSAAPAQPRVPPARTTPAPVPQRCAHPGCGLPLTQAQLTHSMHKAGQPLCPQHLKEASQA